ncbi:flagellar hook-associated protein FlgK [Hydrogenophaga aquatica]
MSSLNIASRALTTNMTALQVIGHNISNANTEGYSRQTVQLQQVPGQLFGNGYFGKGVEIASVERSYNAFLTREANLAKSAAAADNIRYSRLQQLEQLFPMGSAGMGTQLNGFLNSWGDVVASPTNQTARGVVLTRAEEIATRLRQTASQLDEMTVTTRTQIEAGINTVNRLAKDIATLNQKIVEASGSGRSPNDLLDQRDKLVAEMNKYVQTSTLVASDQSMTVFVAGSYPIVLGSFSNTLVNPPPTDTAGNLSLALGNKDAIINNDLLGGGELSGLLRFYNHDIGDVRNQLGRLALSMVELTNMQHKAGLDLNGQPGGNLFQDISFANAIVKDVSNTTTTSIGVIPGDPAAATKFKASDYTVTYASTNEVQIRRNSDGLYFSGIDGTTGDYLWTSTAPSTPLTLTSDVDGDYIDFDGLRYRQDTSTGSFAAGQSLLLRPFATVASQVRVVLSSPSQLAVASPVYVETATGNSGNLQIESLYRPAGTTPPGGWTATTIEFVAGGYTTDGGVTVTPFVSGQPIEVDGFKLTLRGTPSVGDTFTVRDAVSAGVDMRQNAGNGQAMLALRDANALDGYTLSDGYIPVFAAVSSSIQTAKSASTFSTGVAEVAEAARANQAGVNLDEEAARLLQFQQAYQAAAKYLQTAQSIFDTLLQTFR